jgi:hypothetical protein
MTCVRLNLPQITHSKLTSIQAKLFFDYNLLHSHKPILYQKIPKLETLTSTKTHSYEIKTRSVPTLVLLRIFISTPFFT